MLNSNSVVENDSTLKNAGILIVSLYSQMTIKLNEMTFSLNSQILQSIDVVNSEKVIIQVQINLEGPERGINTELHPT